MTELRLTLRGKHLAIFDKHPFPWHEEEFIAGSRGPAADARWAAGHSNLGDVIRGLCDARGELVLRNNQDAGLYNRLWLMYVYVFDNYYIDWAPSVFMTYTLPWRLDHKTIPGYGMHIAVTSIRDSTDDLVAQWQEADMLAAVYQAVFDLSVYAWDIYRRSPVYDRR